MLVTDDLVSRLLLTVLIVVFVWALFSLYTRSLRPDRHWRCMLEVFNTTNSSGQDEAPRALREVRGAISRLGIDHVCESRGFVVAGAAGFPERRAVQLWISAKNAADAAAVATAIASLASSTSEGSSVVVPRVYSSNDVVEYEF